MLEAIKALFGPITDWFKARTIAEQVGFSALLLFGSYVAILKMGDVNLWPLDRDAVRIPIANALQYEATMAHLGQPPTKEIVWSDDPAWTAKTQMFADGALLSIQVVPGAPTSAFWQARPQPAIVAAMQRAPDFVGASPALAEFVPAGCIPIAAHGPWSREWTVYGYNDSKQSVVFFWKGWPDDCEGFFAQNADGSFAVDADGAALFQWVSCSGAH